MSLRDGAGALSVGGTFAAAADFVINGGEVFIMLASFLLNESGLLLLFVGRLSTAAPNVPWLPAGTLEAIATAIALVSAVWALYRLANRFTDRFDKDD